jgi:hypothetical protein
MGTASKPKGVTTSIEDYSETQFQKLIDEGMEYYNANKDSINDEVLDAMAAHLKDHGSETGDDEVVKVSDFTDVAEKAWYYDAVANAVDKKLFNGTSKTTFSPENSMTRGMFATVLHRMEGNPVVISIAPFKDINSKDYFYNGVVWSYTNKIVMGVTEDTFVPGSDITREQIATLFYRTAQYDGKNTTLGDFSSFPDASNVDGYAEEAMKWAVGNGLIKGSDGQLLPRDNATRAQVAQMFLNYQKIS